MWLHEEKGVTEEWKEKEKKKKAAKVKKHPLLKRSWKLMVTL